MPITPSPSKGDCQDTANRQIEMFGDSPLKSRRTPWVRIKVDAPARRLYLHSRKRRRDRLL